LIDLFASTYGWTIDDVLNLTVTELVLVQEAMLERLNRQNVVVSGEGSGFVKPGAKMSPDEFTSRFPESIEEV